MFRNDELYLFCSDIENNIMSNLRWYRKTTVRAATFSSVSVKLTYLEARFELDKID